MFDSAFQYLKGLSASQRLIWFGIVGMAASVVTGGLMGIVIVDGMNAVVFAVSAIMSLIGWYGTQKDADRSMRLKLADAELREEKIRAGLDPADDRTVIKSDGE